MELVGFFEEHKMIATIVHVVSVVFGMGSALVSDILFSFFSKDKKLNATEISTLSILADIVFYSLIVIALSGVALFLSDIEKYLASSKFLAKMTILAVLLVNGYVLNKYIWPHLLKKKFFTFKSERNIRRTAFVCGAISVISWVSVCVLGLMNAIPLNYILIMMLYLFVLALGTLTALLIEKKELN